MELDPGDSRPYDEQEWRGALVSVEEGEIELLMSCGRSMFFQQGDLLWFDGLPLAAIRNRCDQRTVLVATIRAEALR